MLEEKAVSCQTRGTADKTEQLHVGKIIDRALELQQPFPAGYADERRSERQDLRRI